MGNKTSSNPKWATMCVNRVEKLWPPPLKVLDVGSRDGFCMKLFRKKGYVCVAIDIEPQDYAVIKDDFNNPVIQETFDLIFARHVMEHLDSIGGFFETCKRLLNPGGKIFVVFPLQSKREAGVKHKVFIESMGEFRKLVSGHFKEVVFRKMRKKGRTGKYDEVYFAGSLDS